MAQPKKKLRLLVVDDTAENIEILLSLLKNDYMIAAARNGEKALQMAEKNQPDLILLDIMMPGIDGYEVCRRLKENPKTKDIPVIFITALAEVMDETKGFGLGAVDYITKPFNPPTVIARVKTHLDLKMHRDYLEDIVRKRTAQLEKAKEAAEAANKAKGDFLMNMSHELRTPLNGIISAADLITHSESEIELKEMLAIIRTSSDQLLLTVDHILDFSRSKDGELNLNTEPFLMDELLAGLKTEYYHKGSCIPITLDYCFEEESPPNALIGDKIRLKEVFQHLLSNAAKFNAQEPQVTIGIKTLERTESDVLMEFTFTDNGIGIDPAYQDKIFQPFTQVDTTKSRKYDGVGIGLALCGQFAQLMGGQMSVQSALNQGSAFIVSARFELQKNEMPFNKGKLKTDTEKEAPFSAQAVVSWSEHDRNSVSLVLRDLYHALERFEPGNINAYLAALKPFQFPELKKLTNRINDYEYEEALEIIKESVAAMGLDLYAASERFRKGKAPPKGV